MEKKYTFKIGLSDEEKEKMKEISLKGNFNGKIPIDSFSSQKIKIIVNNYGTFLYYANSTSVCRCQNKLYWFELENDYLCFKNSDINNELVSNVDDVTHVVYEV